MRDPMGFTHVFKITGGDIINGGDASIQISNILKDVGADPGVMQRVTVAAYEAEMNVVLYAQEARLEFFMNHRQIRLVVDDRGPGIPDIPLAMQEGYSTATSRIREMGFGAGLGLPNIKKNADDFKIDSRVGEGTRLEITVHLPGEGDR